MQNGMTDRVTVIQTFGLLIKETPIRNGATLAHGEKRLLKDLSAICTSRQVSNLQPAIPLRIQIL